MYHITCKQMGGVCDALIEGETKKEVMEKGHSHVTDTKDKAHMDLCEKMKASSKEDMANWQKKFDKLWDAMLELEM